jgi:predicted RNA-binding protein with PUA-like domain
MKSEPDEFSIDDLERAERSTSPWTGIRNYQARNYMRDGMRLGDRAFFYNSSCPEPGIVGIMKISRTTYPDKTQFDPASKYFDSKSDLDLPRWLNVDVTFERTIRFVSLPELRMHNELASMRILQRGNRLSITPVTKEEWDFILGLVKA